MKTPTHLKIGMHEGPMYFAEILAEARTDDDDFVRVSGNDLAGGIGIGWSTKTECEDSITVLRRCIQILESVLAKSDQMPKEKLEETCDILLNYFGALMREIRNIYTGEFGEEVVDA